MTDLATWAQTLARTLEPLTDSQADAVGRIAAVLDARVQPVTAGR